MRSEIKKLHDKLQTTFIYVTHDQTEALTMGDRIMVLDKGIVQQFDTPQNIYNNPKNKFVAGFLGQMNFVNSRVTDEGVEINGTKIYLPAEVMNRLNGMNDVIIGVRPEKLDGSDYKISVKPEITELTGNSKIVYFKMNDADCSTIIPSDMEVGKIYQVGINISDLYFFDSFSGETL